MNSGKIAVPPGGGEKVKISMFTIRFLLKKIIDTSFVF
jgi:hypothetical protein